jgi:Bacterial-like globin
MSSIFLCLATGGPCVYKGRDMKTSHAGLGITEADWDAGVKHLVATLDKFKVPMKEKDDLLAAAGGSKRTLSRNRRCQSGVLSTPYFASVYVPVHSKSVVPSGLPLAVHVPLPLAPLSIPVPPVSVHLLVPDTITLFLDVPVNV